MGRRAPIQLALWACVVVLASAQSCPGSNFMGCFTTTGAFFCCPTPATSCAHLSVPECLVAGGVNATQPGADPLPAAPVPAVTLAEVPAPAPAPGNASAAPLNATANSTPVVPSPAPVLQGPVSYVANQTTIDVMLYFSSADVNASNPDATDGSVILSFADVIDPSSTVNLTYKELRQYSGQDHAAEINGIHVHKQGPYYQLTFALGNGSIVMNGPDMLSILASPALYYFEVHSSAILASPANPYRSWARGSFPSLVTVVSLLPIDTNSDASSTGLATVQLSFSDVAACAYNARFIALNPPSTIEVDIVNGTESLPLLVISLPSGTSGQCVRLAPGQMQIITGNLRNYRVMMPIAGGGQLTLAGQLDNSVREVALASDNELPLPVPGHGLGRLHLTAATPRAICYWQMQISNNVLNWTAMHIHQGSSSDIGPVIVQFLPVLALTTQPLNPLGGCAVNVSADAMTLFAQASADIYLNLHSLDYPSGVMRGQLPPWGVVPPFLPTPAQLLINGPPAATLPSNISQTNVTAPSPVAPVAAAKSSSSSSVGLIAGIAAAGAAVFVLASCALVFCIMRRRKLERRTPREEQQTDKDPSNINEEAAGGDSFEHGWVLKRGHLSQHSSGILSGQSRRSSGSDSSFPKTSATTLPSDSWTDVREGTSSGRPRRLSGAAGSSPRGSGSADLDPAAERISRGTYRLNRRLSGGQESPSLDENVQSVTKLGIEEVLSLTSNFQTDLIIGEGSFGVVYRATLPDGTEVAIKRANTEALRSLKVFRTEVQLLSRLHHQNLVELVAYCLEPNEQCLIYRYLPNGSLRSWLDPKQKARLSWIARLQIALGTAHGLDYLHTGASPKVVHRDVKSSNILLDADFTAKVADFGYGYVAATLQQVSKVSTTVCGTPGYVDPAYYETAEVTDRSDVYAFGVVLLELLTGKGALQKQAKQQQNLAMLMRPTLKSPDALTDFLEPLVVQQASKEAIAAVGALAARCISVKRAERPSMGEVAAALQMTIKAIEDEQAKDEGLPGDFESSESEPAKQGMRRFNVTRTIGGSQRDSGGILVHSSLLGR